MLSGGGVAFAHNAEGAFQYLKRTCNGTTPDDILRKMAEEMVGMIDWLTELAKVSGTEPTKTETRGHGTYPFPGTNDIDSIKLKDFPAYSEFPWAKGLRGGARLFKVVYDNVNTRKIEVMLATPAKELITNSDGEVIGLVAEHEGKALRIKAKKGVILACGGYENDDAMKLQYFEAQPVYPVYLGNTGDGVKMAQKAGAGLWHMWHFHGGYGFKFPELPFAIRHVWAGPRNENRKMIWIAVDKFGKRFMDEYPPAPQDTGTRAAGILRRRYPGLSAHPLPSDFRRRRPQARSHRYSDRQRRALRSQLERGQSRGNQQRLDQERQLAGRHRGANRCQSESAQEPPSSAGMSSAKKARTMTTSVRRKR